MSNIIFMARLKGGNYRSNANRAEKLLKAHGFSVGRMQAHQPRGLLYGEFDIQKWRNLSQRDREQLDGLLSGRHVHHGDISIEILDSAPSEAVQKLAQAFALEDGATIIVAPLTTAASNAAENSISERSQHAASMGVAPHA
ncbi:hypothetical protein [Brucella sp.]|uniref:hypothetical protein n=1 Tax=Brucella sp. TaxID=52132 RepID=UPI0028A63935|nr:hypothetical protein [Brucella sp.]